MIRILVNQRYSSSRSLALTADLHSKNWSVFSGGKVIFLSSSENEIMLESSYYQQQLDWELK